MEKTSNYKSIINRRISGPWTGFRFLTDPISGAGIFQFPLSAYNPESFPKSKVPDFPQIFD